MTTADGHSPAAGLPPEPPCASSLPHAPPPRPPVASARHQPTPGAAPTPATVRRYPYVGPPELRRALGPAGFRCAEPGDFTDWLSAQTPQDLAEPFTYVVTADSCLRLAPRRSEHVACAEGESVSAAGEIAFTGAWSASHVTNHSTGYCPDITSWSAVAAALGRLGISHPGAFTPAVIFRRCVDCREVNVVRDDFYVCVFCEADLPAAWNVSPP